MISRTLAGILLGAMLALGLLGTVSAYFYGRNAATEDAQIRIDKITAAHNEQMRQVLENSSLLTAIAKQQNDASDQRLQLMLENLPKIYARDKNNVVILDKSGKPIEPHLGSDFAEAWNKIREEYK